MSDVPWRREEWIGGCRLLLGDAREIMPALPPVDCILTDPVWPNAPAESVPGWEDPWGLWREACAALPPHRRIVVVMRTDSDPRFLAPVPGAFFRLIQLPYAVPSYINRVLGSDEYAYWFGECIARARGRKVVPGRAPAAQPSHRPANGHPMSRAQVHFDWLLSWCTDEGESVLDPFMGSGTTGVAAVKLGRPFIGIETDPDFFEISCRRIAEAGRQSDLFVAPAEQARFELGR